MSSAVAALLKNKPSSGSCVKVTSLSAPNLIAPLSVNSDKCPLLSNLNLSLPPILISIWSSVSAVMLVSPSASKISSVPFKSESNGPPTAPDISTINIEAPLAGAVVNVICVPPVAKV